MPREIKKSIYHWITNHRKTRIGKLLYSFSSTINEALENKNNDFNTNGEKWLIDSLDANQPLIVFDVGANIGDWTKLVHHKNKYAQIHSFEPIPAIYERLAQNTQGIEEIKINNLALGEFSGVLEMNYYPQNPIFSSFYNHPLGKNKKNLTRVEVMTGDKYCELNQIEFIDFLKIDVEGFESKVLFGFERMFSEKRIKMIQFEYGDLVLKSNFLLRDFYGFFESRNYKVGKLYPGYVDFDGYSCKKENFIPSNFVCLIN
ncbi:FkbM family methyltransferase [Algoriphagus chordae]|uniref:FkbM family methyltransferase n=1 Tax=Algoriphagus chordae TaxID=237019 RepID=A0A2W7QGK3_9BACT|nr:FkbM family methyltransferase [Algoriphagus chordae]PZX47648.1 FkbM family methyltransferase [Algoriphagus chordae]